MNYENLFIQYQNLEKSLKDKTKLVAKLQKAIAKEMEGGDLAKCITDTASMKRTSEDVTALLEQIASLVASFDQREYVESGEFAEQLLAQCEANGVDVKGNFPNFEMFPNKLRIDPNMDIILDRKKVACIRPYTLVQVVKKGQEKLLKVSYFKLSSEDERDFLEDTITDNKQAIEMANVYTTILTGTMDAFASVIGNNMNLIMKRLTIISIALMFPTLIVSYYGMNIELPYMHQPYAWVGVLSVCGLSAFMGGWMLSDRRNQRLVQRSVQAKRIKEKKPRNKRRKKRALPD